MKADTECIDTTKFALGTAMLLYGLSGFIPEATAIECGDFLTRGFHKLTRNLTCDGPGEPAITLDGGARLDMNRNLLACNDPDREGIVLLGTNARLRNGTVIGCKNGVTVTEGGSRNVVLKMEARDSDRQGFNIEGDNNRVIYSLAEYNGRDGFNVSGRGNRLVANEAHHNDRRGFNIDKGDKNTLVLCLAGYNGRQGIIIDEGNDNRVLSCTAFRSCRDGIEIDGEGQRNFLRNNSVTHNGDLQTCTDAGEEYRPWFYAGIDITEGAVDNVVVYNRTSNNQGCSTVDFDSCNGNVVRNRNLLDENPDDSSPPKCVLNRWSGNRADGARAEPECGQLPSP